MAHPRRTIGVCAVAVFHPEGVVSFIPVSTEKILRRGLTSGIRDLAYSAAKGKSNGDGDG
jgi:hypothetical protein